MSSIRHINIDPESKKPTNLNDTIGNKTGWDPIFRDTLLFKTSGYEQTKKKFILKRSKICSILGYSCLVPGVAGLIGGLLTLVSNMPVAMGFFLLVWGGFFTGGGLFALKLGNKFTIDKEKQIYYKGTFSRKFTRKTSNKHGLVDNIYAVQVLEEGKQSGKISFHQNAYIPSHEARHELNLIFKDASRLKLMDHAPQAEVEETAQAIGEYLRLPVWKGC